MHVNEICLPTEHQRAEENSFNGDNDDNDNDDGDGDNDDGDDDNYECIMCKYRYHEY